MASGIANGTTRALCYDRPMHDYSDTWAIIPLYNEAQVIGDVVRDLRTRIPNVLCIDDGSVDASVEEARKAGAHVAVHPINLGQGAALQTGFSWVLANTDARYVVTFDADGQHQSQDAAHMVDVAREENLGFVLGSRFIDGMTLEMSAAKRVVLHLAAAFSRMRSKMSLTDAHNGLRVIRRDALDKVFLSQNRMAHASQIIEQLGQTGLAWREVGVHIRYTDYSRAKGQSMLNAINILVELMLEDR